MAIYQGEGVNITKTSTTTSLALEIYKTNYLHLLGPGIKLYKINHTSHNLMRLAFYGGRVDAFKPFGNNIKCYDVNSLYPFSMLKHLPVGKPVLSDDTNLDNFFGVVYVEVE